MKLGLGLSLTQPRRESGPWTPARLFSSGGFFVDAADLASLFQDVAGTTPITAVGQKIARANFLSKTSGFRLGLSVRHCSLLASLNRLRWRLGAFGGVLGGGGLQVFLESLSFLELFLYLLG